MFNPDCHVSCAVFSNAKTHLKSTCDAHHPSCAWLIPQVSHLLFNYVKNHHFDLINIERRSNKSNQAACFIQGQSHNLTRRQGGRGGWQQLQIRGGLCVGGGARRAHRVPRIIRISWNYTESAAGPRWRGKHQNRSPAHTPSLAPHINGKWRPLR